MSKLKICVFLSGREPLFGAPAGVMSLEFRRDFCRRKTRVHGLSYGVVVVILHSAVFVQLRFVTYGGGLRRAKFHVAGDIWGFPAQKTRKFAKKFQKLQNVSLRRNDSRINAKVPSAMPNFTLLGGYLEISGPKNAKTCPKISKIFRPTGANPSPDFSEIYVLYARNLSTQYVKIWCSLVHK